MANMCWLLILAFVVLISAPVTAEPLQVAPERVSTVVTEDWNDDGIEDRALLYETEDAVDLLIYLSTGSSKSMALHTRATGIAWRSPGIGTDQPTLALSSDKSLHLTESSFGFGRYPFERTLTIEFKEGVFRVTDYSFMAYDRLAENGGDGGSCYISLLTGEGKRNGNAFRADVRVVPVAEWVEEKRPPECSFFE